MSLQQLIDNRAGHLKGALMIFVFDLDGTICFKGQPLTTDICAALDECVETGHEVVFASARPIRDLLPVLPERYHGYRMVGGNGAFTRHGDQSSHVSFDADTIEQLKALTVQHEVKYLFDSDWEYSYTGGEEQPLYEGLDPLKLAKNRPLHELTKVSKAVLFTDDEVIRQAVSALPVTIFRHHAERLIDITPAAINKAAGLERLGIKDYIAFGNDQNDHELFTYAVYSVCVGKHPVSQFADEITSPDEVGRTITRLAARFQEKVVM